MHLRAPLAVFAVAFLAAPALHAAYAVTEAAVRLLP